MPKTGRPARAERSPWTATPTAMVTATTVPPKSHDEGFGVMGIVTNIVLTEAATTTARKPIGLPRRSLRFFDSLLAR